ncbi:hypothetical protein HGO97_023415 [Faecalicatena sp. AGMB00832]|uniref:Uncharacterized protein n=1 Tax=Faecalicatena faecalis TaxID=2726362 RepID=A0ABS6DAU3_9FIRM|nr:MULTISPECIES: DUF6809 family protein [Faecalicatena]MBU3878749.1 hypothetical protein [Faecalicatena faecalis]MCI6465073.1 hypothetical protein [Faecalicatena sp.]MDY5617096.1 hypothetical protein [Lachnospiraceae bacterium]
MSEIYKAASAFLEMVSSDSTTGRNLKERRYTMKGKNIIERGKTERETIEREKIEREYIVDSKEIQQAVLLQREADQKFNRYLSELEQTDKAYLEKYMELIEHTHCIECQRSYCQGFMDGIQMLGDLDLIKNCKNIGELLRNGKR